MRSRPALAVVRAALLAFGLLSSPAIAAERGARPRPVAKNLILLIGDGMGQNYLTLARDFARHPLALDPWLVGASATASSDSRVTDSAAGATALGCGIRTVNQAIGVDSLGRAHRTLLEAAEARGKATGLVVVSRITHATPAAFAAHVAKRADEPTIAAQMNGLGIEVLLGGGRRFFLPESAGGSRADGRDLEAEARKRGVSVVLDREGLRKAGAGPLLGLFHDDHMSYVLDRDTLKEPSLVEMTRAALRRLAADPQGFFLMVEGSRIDHAGHLNDPATAVREVQEFDDAFQAALEFARRDKRTLVVVTADHETGGMSMGCEVDSVSVYDWHPEVLRKVRRSAERMAERIAAGASADSLIAVDAGIPDLTPAESRAIRETGGNRAVAIGRAVSRRALVGWTGLGHTAVDVPVFAYGPGAESLKGTHANDELGRLMARLLGLEIGTPLP